CLQRVPFPITRGHVRPVRQEVRGGGRRPSREASHPAGHGLEMAELAGGSAGGGHHRRISVSGRSTTFLRRQVSRPTRSGRVMSQYFRYPQTPHIRWLADGIARHDKVLSEQEVADLLSGVVTVE